MTRTLAKCTVALLSRAVALPLVAAGCGGPGADQTESDIALAATTENVFTLGGTEVPDWQHFAEVTKVLFDGAGNLVLVDRPESRIVVVGPEGEFRHFVSRVGGGPGEFRTIIDMGVMRDNRLVVSELMHNALLLYDTDGSFVEQFPFGPQPDAVASTGPGVMLRQFQPPTILGSLPGDRVLTTTGASRTLAIHTFGQGATELYRAYRRPPDNTGAQESGITTRIGGLTIPLDGLLPREVAFAPPFAVEVLADGRTVLADSVGYRVKLLRDDGSIDAVLERPIQPIAVTPAIREAERQRREARGGVSRPLVIGPNMSGAESDALSTARCRLKSTTVHPKSR